MMIPMQSNNGNQLQNQLISTNISVKLGTVSICIGIGIGSMETVLHIIIEPNFIGIRIRISVGIWAGQCKPSAPHVGMNGSAGASERN